MPARPRPIDRSRAVPFAAGIAAVLAVAGCGAGPGAAPAAEAPSGSPAASSPLTIDNCGFEVEFDSAPERVVTIKSSAAEMLLALGLGDRIVGSAFLDGPPPGWLGDAAAGTPVEKPFSDDVPGTEATLELEPDLVYAGWESNVTSEGAGDRETLSRLGVATYVSPSACKAAGYMPDPLTFDAVFAEIEQVGAIFGAHDAAAELVAEQRRALDAVVPDDRGLDALWYSSGDDIPYVGAGIGAPQMILDAVGLSNVAGDVHDTWTPFAWEKVVAADPDVIVLVDATWNSADDKVARLEGNPATAQLTAVRERRYLTIPFPASEAGVRNVDAVEDLAAQLAELDLDE
jgi:iron complex transport system substrate-binding protein